MITHAIVRYVVKPKRHKIVKPEKGRFEGKLGGQDHRLFILRRAVKNCPFTENEKVLYKRDPFMVNVIYDEDDFSWLEWDGLSPKFIEIVNSAGEFFYVNSGQLKKSSYRK